MAIMANRTRTIIFQASAVIIVIVVGFGLLQKSRLERGYKQDFDLFVNTTQQNIGDAQVRSTLAGLASRYPRSPVVIRNYGLALGVAGQYAEAASYYRKALDLNPFYARQGPFLYENGVWLMQTQDFARAKIYLEAAAKLELPETIKAEVAKHLADLQKRGF